MQIFHCQTRKVLFDGPAGSLRELVKTAIKAQTDLLGANLRGAILLGATLRGADLRGANLQDANLRGGFLIDAGQDARGYRFVAHNAEPGKTFVIIAGCRFFTLAEAKKHWASDAECLAKVDLIEAVARQRGWTADGEKAKKAKER